MVPIVAACSAQPSTIQTLSTAAPTRDAETIIVRLSSFSFEPDTFRLMVNRPVLLRLVNDSSGGHNFSAPAFFAASNFPSSSSAPTSGKVEVGSHQTVDIHLVPHVQGTYPLECTHPLHALFGMTGTIEVMP
jgi:plastocyanin